MNAHLHARGLTLQTGTIVDATIIHAPSSTKNREGKRDPQMHQTRKGNQWYFGMKAHIGVDAHSGLVHTVTATGKEKHVHADAGYSGARKRVKSKLKWSIAEKRSKQKQLPEGLAQAAWRELERPDLDNETAESYSVGVTIQPRWVEDLVFTADYINIELQQAIQPLDLSTIMASCYDSPSAGA